MSNQPKHLPEISFHKYETLLKKLPVEPTKTDIDPLFFLDYLRKANEIAQKAD